MKECREREKVENYDGDEEEYRCHMGKARGPIYMLITENREKE